MSILLALAMGAALVVPQSATTQAPAKEPIDAKSLGTAQALFDFCAKIDSGSAQKYHDLFKKMTEGQTATALDEARNSDEFKEGFNSTAESLAKSPKPSDYSSSCKAILERK